MAVFDDGFIPLSGTPHSDEHPMRDWEDDYYINTNRKVSQKLKELDT